MELRRLPQGKSPAVLGLYIGVILGAVGMMVFGALGKTAAADLSLIFGLLAGPSIGYVIGKLQPAEPPQSSRHDEAKTDLKG